MVLISKACTEWYWSIHTFEEQNWYASASSKVHVIAKFTGTCPLTASCPVILSFQTGMDAPLLNYMCLGVCGLLESLQWCSSAGCNNQSFSSGIPVWGSFIYFSSVVPVYPAIFAGSPNGIPVYIGSISGKPVYTGPGSVHLFRVRVLIHVWQCHWNIP